MDAKAFKELRRILAGLYRDEASIRRILDDAEIDSSRIAFHAASINTWHSILVEAATTDKLDSLLAIIISEYHSNEKLAQAYTTYQQSDRTVPEIATSEQNFPPFLWRNRWFIGIVLLFEVLLLTLFLQYKNQFMLPLSSFAIAALFLYVTLQAWQIAMSTLLKKKSILLLALFFSITWSSFVYRQVFAAIFPTQIEPDKFGIAIATLYDGKIFSFSQENQRITDSLENQLKFTLQNEEVSTDDITVKRVGVVRNNEEALIEGRRVGAELILWGEISQQPAYTTIFLQLLETSLLTENPDFPRTLPLAPQISLKIPVKTINPQDLAEILNPQNLGLANFSLGMFLYEYRQAPGQAAVKFEMAKRQFEAIKYNSERMGATLGWTSPFDASAKLNLGLVYYYLAKSYQLQGAYTKSQTMLQEAAQYLPRDLAVWLAMMYNLRAMGDESEFHNIAQCIVDMADQINEIRIISKFCPPLINDNEQESLDVSTVNVPTVNRFNQALAYEALNQYDQALSLYESILRPGQNPDFFIAHLSAASVLTKLGRLDDAKTHYERAKDLVNGNLNREAAIHIGLANWYESQNKWDGALLEYNAASELSPELPRPYLNRAIIYGKQNLDILARQSYIDYIVRVEKQGYNIGSAYHSFAQYLYDSGAYEEAITNYRQALLFETEKAVVFAHIGQTYVELGEKNKALEAFQKAIQNPNHNRSYIYDLYGRALVTFGCIDEAINQFDSSVQASKDIISGTITKLNLASQYQAIGNKQKAIEIYESISLFDVERLSQEQQYLLEGLQKEAQEQSEKLKSITEPKPPIAQLRSTCIGDDNDKSTP